MFYILFFLMLAEKTQMPYLYTPEYGPGLISVRETMRNTGQIITQHRSKQDVADLFKSVLRSKSRKKPLQLIRDRQDPYEPNNTPATAYLIIYGDTLTQAIIEPPGDEDYFRFTGNAGDTVTIDIDASINGSWLDSYLELYGTDSVTLLAENDDWGSLDSRIMNFILPATGTYFIRVTDLGSNGGPEYYYHIWITDIPIPCGWIAGTVTDSITGQPLIDVLVEIYDTNYMYCGSGFTDGSGVYLTDELGTGLYKVHSSDWSGYANKWYDNKLDFETADTVRVLGFDTTGNIDFQLSSGACISGTVTDSVSGQPIADVWVDIYDTLFYYAASAFTDDSGNYLASGLTGGLYKLNIWNPGSYITEWYDNKLDFDTADTVRAAGLDTTFDIDFELSLGGLISGTVTDSISGQPIMDVNIEVYDWDYNIVSWAYTDLNGHYITYAGLRNGTYKLFAYDYYSGAYEWYRNRTDFSSADPVSIFAPDTTEGIDFDLFPTGITEDANLKKPASIFCEITPNPARSGVTINYAINIESNVSLKVYNILGQRLATLVNKVCSHGSHYYYWSLNDDGGKALARGIYFLEFITGKDRITRKVIIAK